MHQIEHNHRMKSANGSTVKRGVDKYKKQKTGCPKKPSLSPATLIQVQTKLLHSMLLRKKHFIDNMNHAIRLIDICNRNFRGTAAFIRDKDRAILNAGG